MLVVGEINGLVWLEECLRHEDNVDTNFLIFMLAQPKRKYVSKTCEKAIKVSYVSVPNLSLKHGDLLLVMIWTYNAICSV